MLASSSFERFICTLFEQLNSNWYGISIPPHSCLRLQPITSTLLSLISTQHCSTLLNTDFSTTRNKKPRYSGQLARQMADRFIALHYFHGVFVHGVVKLSFSNKFFSDRWLAYVLINMISTHSTCGPDKILGGSLTTKFNTAGQPFT